MLLDRIQRSFPLVPEPYSALSKVLGINGSIEVQDRIRSFKELKLVRQISAIFNTGALGYRSSLVAMAVPEEELDRAASAINHYAGVSHNYLRPGNYNMWFTIAVPPGRSLEEEVDKLSRTAGGWPTLILPALRKYKLAVVLDVLEELEADSGEERTDVPPTEASFPFEPTSDNIRLVRCIQEDLPLVERPFKAWADELGMSEEDLLNTISSWLDAGIIRRFAAVLNHRQVGFSANGMVVWNCPEESIDVHGRTLASHSEVSHCYYRPSYPQWPYNLYAMIHGRSRENCKETAERLNRAIRLPDYDILFSTREFKKIRLKLFWEEPDSIRN
jgi:DNA-binding Lrp family transcriptional regulator